MNPIEAFFLKNHYLNSKEVAIKCKINYSLFRQYMVGIKDPGTDRVKLIQKVINEMGKELANVKL